MRNFCNAADDDPSAAGEKMGSEIESKSVLEKGEQGLHELTSEFLRSDDPDVVGRLYVAHFKKIVRHLGNRHKDNGLAEDAVQEAFKALQGYYTEHRAMPDDPISYLLTAARNWLNMQRRAEAVRRETPLAAIPSVVFGGAFPNRPKVREPIEAVASIEIKDVAKVALKELDKRTRKIIELRKEGREFDEIAQAVGMKSGEAARKAFDHAVHHVRAALGAHFSSFVTEAEAGVRRFLHSRRSAEQAIDLLPPPYAEVLRLLLIGKLTEKEAAAKLGSSPQRVKEDRERALELFQKKYGMTEDELLDLLFHGV